jgi:hypothetical protein
MTHVWSAQGQFPGPKKLKKWAQKSTPHFWAHLGSGAHFLVFSLILILVDSVGDGGFTDYF